MKKHADNLTPSHFGEANDSKINRKQRHRKHCETRDDSGVYQSSRARWKHSHTHTRHRPSRHLQGSYFLRLQAVRVISKFCMIDECQQLFVKRLESPYLLSGVPKVIQKKKRRSVLCVELYQLLLFPPENNCQIMQVPQLPVCGLHVTVAAWFPHVSTSVCTTEEEEVEIMKYRNLWKRGSFRKRACLTEIPRIMEKWQKGKHGKGIVKQPVTETFFCFVFPSLLVFGFTESHRGNINPLTCRMLIMRSLFWSKSHITDRPSPHDIYLWIGNLLISMTVEFFFDKNPVFHMR